MASKDRPTLDVLLFGEALAQDCGPVLVEQGYRPRVAENLARAEALLKSQPLAILVAATQDPPNDFQIFDLAQALRPELAALAVTDRPLGQALAAAASRHYPHHFISHSPLDRRDLGFTLQKLASGEIFGMERYDIPLIEKIEFRESEGRYPAAGKIKDFFLGQNIAGRIAEKVELALHELTMNAARQRDRTGNRNLPVELAYGLGKDALAVSVCDPFGDLDSATLYRAIGRAATEKSVINEPGRGAGLGLFLILKASGRLIFNVSPGRRTEAIAIFHRANSLGESAKMGHAFHYFQESSHEPKT